VITIYSEERRNFINDLINEKGKITVKELSEMLSVSKVTIRSDLESLDKRNLITRTYGGAIKKDTILKKYTLNEKQKLNIDAKTAIANEAVAYIKDNMVIYLDSGTTTKIMLTLLDKIDNLTIVTSDILIAYEASELENVQIILLGGTLDKQILSTNSGETLVALDNLYFDISFIGCDGFDDNNAYTSSEIRSLMKHKVINNSKTNILLADSSKYNNKNQFIISNVNNINLIISDKGNEQLEKSNLDILLSPVASDESIQ